MQTPIEKTRPRWQVATHRIEIGFARIVRLEQAKVHDFFLVRLVEFGLLLELLIFTQLATL